MDSGKFDRLARVLAAAPSRRSMLRGLAGAALGAGVVVTAPPGADAADVVGRCPRGKNSQCGDNEKCRNERCVCRKGYDACKVNGRQRCIDLDTDNDNCGRCGRRCDNQKRCVDGECERFEDPEDGSCTFFRCGDNGRECCPGFACRAGNDFLRACVYVG